MGPRATVRAVNALLKYRGREVTTADAAFIRQLIAASPLATRRALSQQLCAAWNWVQANGAPRDMVCRGLLLALHRAGHIQLPPHHHLPPNPLARRAKPAPTVIDTTPLSCGLRALQPLTFQQVRRTPAEPLFNSLIEQYHYLGYTQRMPFRYDVSS